MRFAVPTTPGEDHFFDAGAMLVRNVEGRSERDDVVVPEDGLDFGQVGFREVRAGIGGTIVYAADFERQRVSLRGSDKICTEGGEFGCEAIANVEGHAERGSDNCHSERERCKRQQLAMRASREGVGDEAGET